LPPASGKGLHRSPRQEAIDRASANEPTEYQSKFKDRAALYKDWKDKVEMIREYNRKLSKSH
jgi:hypothetical protein